MLRRLSLSLMLLCLAAAPFACAQAAPGQQQAKVTLDVSETLFGVMTAINSCGYDQELSASDPLRLRIRAEVQEQIDASVAARYAERDLCTFYRDHQQGDQSRTVAQYTSLALNLGAPPAFAPNIKEADMPPDAAYVLGIQPFLQRFYIAVDLHSIWLRHRKDYESFIERDHEAVSQMLMATDIYLKLPTGGYAGRSAAIYLEPMIAPSQTNARNYDADYFIVVSPSPSGLAIDQIRHTYLHFVLDPMALRRGTTMQRLSALLPSVQTAPMDAAYKKDITLLVTESLIRAIEARMMTKETDANRLQKVNEAAQEGFILAPHFYQQLLQFEKDPIGLNNAYGDWLYYIDVPREKHRASQIAFAKTAAPDVVRPTPTKDPLADAEASLSSGDFEHAKALAQHALDTHQAEPGRIYFLLARISSSAKDAAGAQNYFEKAIAVSREPRVIAWSHIYLGKIYDLKSEGGTLKPERDTAVQHYRAALQAGDTSSYTKAAAERGLKEPYQSPASQRTQGTQTGENTK